MKENQNLLMYRGEKVVGASEFEPPQEKIAHAESLLQL
jgi:hypothetical protein